ncbi:tn3 transposase DDE domain protein [Escherichia coli 3-073-06_S3_C2]|nr:tn3 transposase DDE domain protein [Escherichia coli 2-011-08_S3_C2]KDY83739.1 tn3 transposase DDE domain protein [Escherichia coli 2-474-04_S3_C1]KDZ07309.1 tn3 transposase DDE domain protein [Escherichia coli 2-474-04_S3_C3]KDZ59274.1 tn3 transposase DDE domain protein [Escherichia coli 3-073-06_S3_C2]
MKYLRDPQMERNIRRSQNRIESYHQLRAAVAKVGGKKELTGKNDIETLCVLYSVLLPFTITFIV